MSTLLEDTASTLAVLPRPDQRLRMTMAAARVSLRWFGTRKTLSADQKARAADAFGAEGEFLSAGKKLLDTRHPTFRAVTAVKGKILSYWKAVSLPYPEPGLRLIRQDRIDPFHAEMNLFQSDLDKAVERLDQHFAELKATARRRLGSLYNGDDYPQSLAGLFAVSWEFPSVEPPDYLRQLNPELYQEQCRRIQERFNEAVRLAEEAFTSELAQLISHLSERLSGREDGQAKIFRDSAVGNLQDFFTRFQDLNVRSNEELDRLVADARRIVAGVEPQGLRDNNHLRQHVASELSRVQSVLDGLLIDRPRRRILRKAR